MKGNVTFSNRATVDDKVHLIFSVYDSDDDGLVAADDMELMLRQLAGSALRYALQTFLWLADIAHFHHHWFCKISWGGFAAAPICSDGLGCRDEELRALISRALQQAGAEAGLSREQFSDALINTDLGAMSVSIDASMY